MFFNKEKKEKKHYCDGSNLFVAGFFIIITTYFLLEYMGYISSDFLKEFFNK